MSLAQIQKVVDDIEFIEGTYRKLLKILPSFKVTDETVLPYGLKPHTRSVSWLVEQVITQQTKYRKDALGLDGVDFNVPDTCLHDCIIDHQGKKMYVNVKAHNVNGKENKNDIAAVEKLYMQYSNTPSYDLIYACFGIRFEGVKVVFDENYLEIFSPQFMPIYVNPRNDKVQSFYKHTPEKRTREIFLELLKKSSKSIVL